MTFEDAVTAFSKKAKTSEARKLAAETYARVRELIKKFDS